MPYGIKGAKLGVAMGKTEASLVETLPPQALRSGSHVLWAIARRELADHVISARFLVIALLAIGLTPLAVYVGSRDYSARLGDYNRLYRERQELAAGPAGGGIERAASPFSRRFTVDGTGDSLKVLRALRPPEPLSVLTRGLDGAMPEYWDFSPAGIEVGPIASRPQRLADLLGQLDLEFLVRVVLGLLAILLAFDAVSGEKELGTLRAVLSQPVSRPAFLGGKLAGGATTLLVPLVAAFLMALLSAQFFGVHLLSADNLAKIALVAAASALYLVCFYALGLLISSLTASQKTSLVLLLVIWVLAVLAVPPLATLVAQAASPVPPAHAFEAQKRALDGNLRRESSQAMGAIWLC